MSRPSLAGGRGHGNSDDSDHGRSELLRHRPGHPEWSDVGHHGIAWPLEDDSRGAGDPDNSENHGMEPAVNCPDRWVGKKTQEARRQDFLQSMTSGVRSMLPLLARPSYVWSAAPNYPTKAPETPPESFLESGAYSEHRCRGRRPRSLS